MANRYTDATFLSDFQQTKRVQTELKKQKYGIIEGLKADTADYAYLTPELQAHIETQMDRSFSMPALKETTITTSTSESFDIPANLSTSDTVTATLTTIFSGFHFYDELVNENMVGSKEEYINNKMMEISKAMAQAKEVTLLATIDGVKSQVLTYNPGANDGFTFAASLLTASLAAQQARFFPPLETILDANGIGGEHRLIASPSIKMMENYADQYGQANSKDLQDQGFLPEVYTSNNVTNAVRWTGYAFPKGSFAMVNNYKSDFVKGTNIGDTAIWGISNEALPFLNEQVMTYYEIGKADNSALLANSTESIMSKVEKFAFVHRYLTLTPYNSDISANVNPVVKIAGATS